MGLSEAIAQGDWARALWSEMVLGLSLHEWRERKEVPPLPSVTDSKGNYDQTDRQTQLHGNRVTRVTFQSQLRKKYRSLLEINCSQGETALCCAVLALSGTDTLVSLIPRPVPGQQRLDDRRSPLGTSQHKKKRKKKLLSSVQKNVNLAAN